MKTEKTGLIQGVSFKYALNQLKKDIDDKSFTFVLLHYAHKELKLSKEEIQEILNSRQLDLN